MMEEILDDKSDPLALQKKKLWFRIRIMWVIILPLIIGCTISMVYHEHARIASKPSTSEIIGDLIMVFFTILVMLVLTGFILGSGIALFQRNRPNYIAREWYSISIIILVFMLLLAALNVLMFF